MNDAASAGSGAIGFRTRAHGASHVGLVRKLNEDAWIARPDVGLYAVSDGMGGHQAGDLASKTIMERLASLSGAGEPSELLAAVRDALGDANSFLRIEARNRGGECVIGATVVVVLIRGRYVACAWAGDSRLYRYRSGQLSQLTRDHSQVQLLVDAGVITAEDAERHPQANVVTRAIGAYEDLHLDQIGAILEPDDIFLLCTDGLTKMIAEAEIAQILARTDLASQPSVLIDAALKRGGKDNVTAVVVGVDVAA